MTVSFRPRGRNVDGEHFNPMRSMHARRPSDSDATNKKGGGSSFCRVQPLRIPILEQVKQSILKQMR
jgi:hypothetical protein